MMNLTASYIEYTKNVGMYAYIRINYYNYYNNMSYIICGKFLDF